MKSKIVSIALAYSLSLVQPYSANALTSISESSTKEPARNIPKEENPNNPRFFPFIAQKREDYIFIEEQQLSLVHNDKFYSLKGKDSSKFNFLDSMANPQRPFYEALLKGKRRKGQSTLRRAVQYVSRG